MYKDIRVLIFEDGPYARDMMSLLLTRDWRTRVVGEAARKSELVELLADEHLKSDIAIIDTEIPGKPDLPLELAALLQNLPHPPKILFTGTLANPRA